jgi:hypothetical protein
LNFIQVNLSVVELLKFVVIDLASDEASGVFAINFSNLITHESYRVGRTQLQFTLVVSVASSHLEGNEVECLFNPGSWNRQEKRHHGIKSSRYAVTLVASYGTLKLTME